MRTVFVDVDTQHDFCDPTGALFVAGAPVERFVALTQLAQARGIPILGSVDSHAYDAWEFASNDNVGPNGEDPRFPDHCVKGTPGWLKVPGTLPARHRFVPLPAVATEGLVVELEERLTQAIYFEKEVYSLFVNDNADPIVTALAARPTRFVVYGVATDYCVRAAAEGLVDRGHQVVVLTDAIAAVDPTAVDDVLANLARRGVELTTMAALAGDV